MILLINHSEYTDLSGLIKCSCKFIGRLMYTINRPKEPRALGQGPSWLHTFIAAPTPAQHLPHHNSRVNPYTPPLWQTPQSHPQTIATPHFRATHPHSTYYTSMGHLQGILLSLHLGGVAMTWGQRVPRGEWAQSFFVWKLFSPTPIVDRL